MIKFISHIENTRMTPSLRVVVKSNLKYTGKLENTNRAKYLKPVKYKQKTGKIQAGLYNKTRL